MGEIVRELLKLQEEEGWLAPDRLEGLAAQLRVPLHRIESVSTFYPHFRRQPSKGTKISVCRDLSCRLAGAESAVGALCEWAAGRDDVVIAETSCLGRCDQAPAAALGHQILDASDRTTLAACVAATTSEPVSRAIRDWPAADPYSVVNVETPEAAGPEAEGDGLRLPDITARRCNLPDERQRTQRLSAITTK